MTKASSSASNFEATSRTSAAPKVGRSGSVILDEFQRVVAQVELWTGQVLKRTHCGGQPALLGHAQ
jgi:hypothetical protein